MGPLPERLSTALCGALRAVQAFWHGPPKLPQPLAVEWRFVAMRWLGILILLPGLLVVPLSPERRLAAYAVLGVAAAYNLVVQRLLERRPERLANGYATTGGDALLNLLMIGVGGGFDTPFYFILFTTTIATAMRYGYGPSLVLVLIVFVADLGEDLVGGRSPGAPFVFRTLALSIAVLLASYLRQEVRQAQAALEERLRQASLLNAATQDLGASLESDRALRAVVAAVAQVFGTRCVVLRVPARVEPQGQPILVEESQVACTVQHDRLRALCVRYADRAAREPAQGPSVVREELPDGGQALVLVLRQPARPAVLATLAVALPAGQAGLPLDPDLFDSFLERLTLAIENAALYELQEALNGALAEREARLSAVLANVAEGIITVDERGRISSFNLAAERLFGYPAAEALGRPIGRLLPALLGRLPSGRAGEPCPAGAGVEVAGGRREATAVRRDGTVFPVEVAVSALRAAEQPLFIVSVHDITERKAAEAALEHQALHDQLTHLPNRTLFRDRLQQALLAGQREGRPVAVLIVDLDRFKEVNDTFGHLAGDWLLQDTARRFQEALRASDTIARLGGDEFAVLLPGTDRAGAVHVARNLLRALDVTVEVEGQNVTVGASIGIALAPEHGQDADTLLRRADVAMYVAKRGGDTYAVYSAEADQNSPGRIALLGDLRKGLTQGQLVLYYQPRVSLARGEITAVEALVRWQHPQRGLLLPDQFVPLAEQTGLIGALTDWVLDAALRQCAAWNQTGLDLGIAVNFSMRNFQDLQLPERIAARLARWQVAATRLEVEITESAIMADPARAQEILARLHGMGVAIAIDDFGTGYSSLGHLKRLPVDEIKIDKSFVRDMTVDASDLAIVRSTIELGHNLGLEVVAEGVERQTTWELLVGLGCDHAQGFYISRPLPPAEFLAWAARSSWKLRGRLPDDAAAARPPLASGA